MVELWLVFCQSMQLAHITKYLEDRLKGNMPGGSAHRLMQPKLENGAPIRINHKVSPKKGGVLILFYEESGNVRFPLIQRPEYEGIHSGQIALPGGGKEDEDIDLTHTALREAEEEIGVDQNRVQVIGALTQFFVAASNYDILPVIGYYDGVPDFTPDSREVSSIITPRAIDLLDEKKRRIKDITVRNGFTLSSPYFDLEDKVVWGATAMMLSELVTIFDEFNF